MGLKLSDFDPDMKTIWKGSQTQGFIFFRLAQSTPYYENNNFRLVLIIPERAILGKLGFWAAAMVAANCETVFQGKHTHIHTRR